MKICSLLPSATEILFALGLGDEVAGVSHECDFPPEAQTKPILIRSRIETTASAAEIDRQVRAFLERGESIYSVDIDALTAIDPDLIITQDLCHVCAATPEDLGAALAHLPRQPRVLTLNPHSLHDICDDIRRVGEATSRPLQTLRLIADFEQNVASVSRAVARLPHKRVVCMEWLDPLYVAGHWVPEMVARAGGVDVLGSAGKPSFRVGWNDVLEAQAEVVVIMPCGYTQEHALQEFSALCVPPEWLELPAVRNNAVFIVEASGYFSRPGPRIADGTAMLASAIHGTAIASPLPGRMRPVLARAAVAGK
jgi:iron complex transport system substrate-binding protein